VPTIIPRPKGLEHIREVVCGYYWTTFISHDDNVWAVGRNEDHRCGLSESKNYLSIEKINYRDFMNNIDIVACGWEFSIFLTSLLKSYFFY
jgi:alpha-tubulin suppressor-like RCC1 family protein